MQVGAMIEVDALLPLVAVATQVDDHLARHRGCHPRTVVLLDEVERHVDARCDTGAGSDAAILHEKAVAHHFCARIPLLQLVHPLPVRGAAAAVEQAGLAEHERAGADRAHLRSALERLLQPLAQPARRPDLAHRIAGNDHHVVRSHIGQRLKASERHTLRARDGRRGRAMADDVVSAELPGFIEGLNGPADVEHLGLRYVNEDYAAARLDLSFNSVSSCATVVMRAKRRRNAYSVRSRMASTPSSSPGLS